MNHQMCKIFQEICAFNSFHQHSAGRFVKFSVCTAVLLLVSSLALANTPCSSPDVSNIIVPDDFDCEVFAAGLFEPTDLAVEDNGNVLVTQSGGTVSAQLVLRFSPQGDLIAESDPIIDPDGVAVDSQGRVFVAGGQQITIANSLDGGVDSVCQSGFSNLNNVAIDSQDRIVAVEDSGGSVWDVQCSQSATLCVSLDSGGNALAFDDNDQLFAGQTENPGTIGRIDGCPNGTYTAISDNLARPARLAFGTGTPFGDDVFVSEFESGVVSTVNETTGATTDFATGFLSPFGIAFDGTEAFYVAEQGLDRIIRIFADEPCGEDAISTFDTDLEGWTCDLTSCSWNATGGNQDGYLRFDDLADGLSFAVAPPTFLGDWSPSDRVGTLSFDHRIFSTGDNAVFFPYEVQIYGPGGSSAVWLGDTPSDQTDWVTVTVPLDEAEWTVTGAWSDLIEDVQEVRIRIEQVSNSNSPVGDVAGIDNVILRTCTVNEPPDADPNGPYNGTVGVAIAFDGSGSSDLDGSIVAYDWDFGDGNTGTGVSPTYTYATAGTYPVSLTVTDDAGATDTETTTATITEIVNEPPNADPNGPYNGTVGVAIAFDGSGSSDPDGSIVAYDWDFGDGNTGSGVSPRHTYAAAGTYTVSLTVVDDEGAQSMPATTTTTIAPREINCDINGNGKFDWRDTVRFAIGCRKGTATWACDLNDDGRFNWRDTVRYWKMCRKN